MTWDDRPDDDRQTCPYCGSRPRYAFVLMCDPCATGAPATDVDALNAAAVERARPKWESEKAKGDAFWREYKAAPTLEERLRISARYYPRETARLARPDRHVILGARRVWKEDR